MKISHTRTIVSGIAGVVLMTLFSGIVSGLSRQEYAEHKVLAKLINRMRLKLDKRTSFLLGWKGHLLAGMGFSYLNKALLESGLIKPTIKSAVPVGIMEGLIGIAIWKTAFALHHDPPRIDLKKFFSQLVVAHVVYAVVAILGMRARSS